MRFARVIETEPRAIARPSSRRTTDSIILATVKPSGKGDTWVLELSTHTTKHGIVTASIEMQPGVAILDVLHGIKKDEAQEVIKDTIRELKESIDAKSD